MQVGDKVIVTLDPNLSLRYFAFQFLIGVKKEIVDISIIDGEIHQLAIMYAGGRTWFFPSELKKI